ncbi:MAG: glycosyltransferase family 39 protein [Anaerolineaceae bacterium]|jgi:hypothetical protein
MRLSRLELILIILGFIGLWVGLSLVAGGPIHSDEVWYMQAGLNNVKDSFIINRYFHIYLQKLFMLLAPSPLSGVKIFWSFLVSLTTALVYLLARLLSGTNNFVHGILAVVLLFYSPLITKYSGDTIVDISAMAMVMVVTALYFFSLRAGKRRKWWLAALGFAFFLAFKTKETTLPVGIVFLGLGLFDGKRIDLSGFWKNIRFVLIGLAVGFVFFIFLNAINLGDPLFGFKPTNVQQLSSSLVSEADKGSDNWYTSFVLPQMALLFLLFIASAFKSYGWLNFEYKLLWFIPLGLVVLLSLSEARGGLGIRDRYMLPALPIFCLLAPQFLDFEIPYSCKEKLKFAIYLVAGVVVFYILHKGIVALSVYVHQNYENFVFIVVFPIVLSILLAVIFLFNRYSTRTVLIPLLCLLGLTFQPTFQNLKDLFVVRPVEQQFENKYFPFSAFSDQIHFSGSMKMYVSTDIPPRLGMLSLNVDELLSMFNVYFDANAVRQNFVYSKSPQSISAAIIQQNFNYVLLTAQDWAQVEATPDGLAKVKNVYQVLQEPTGRLILLKPK